MDRLIYTAMTGAKHVLEKQATVSNNLANVNSTGFKAQIDAFRAVPVVGAGLNTRAFVVDSTPGIDLSTGPIQETGNNLDVAVQGEGFLSVQRADGTEGYTRNGSLIVDENGLLKTSSGLKVIGDGGPISIPPNVSVSIGGDGTISSVNKSASPGPSTTVGRLKLVKAESINLVRSEDGLFMAKDSNPLPADANVKVAGGYLEGSNVGVVGSMVDMISLGRQFDLQMKMIQTAETNEEKASQIFSLNG